MFEQRCAAHRYSWTKEWGRDCMCCTTHHQDYYFFEPYLHILNFCLVDDTETASRNATFENLLYHRDRKNICEWKANESTEEKKGLPSERLRKKKTKNMDVTPIDEQDRASQMMCKRSLLQLSATFYHLVDVIRCSAHFVQLTQNKYKGKKLYERIISPIDKKRSETDTHTPIFSSGFVFFYPLHTVCKFCVKYHDGSSIKINLMW